MDGATRRNKIIEIIRKSDNPVSGASLAKELDVSRQVIVTDIALIRANGVSVTSTNRGYVIDSGNKCKRIIKSRHTDEQILDELFTIVDNGGCAENIIINHRYYNRLEAPLNVSSRRAAKEFMDAIESGKSKSLSSATSGYHYHVISADSEDTLDVIENELKEKGYWLPLDDWILQ
ncbi:transcription repressor NadR [Pseudobutyrivibrio sp. MD2005]|uniref:transcription repressor NadR n=1 Tax=Pseudobutyrivibrio sp. MD2005 TaxID=1410616 RepID=UPI0004827D75|nr:transcription repressor NadR [Pseudobutyrivibrio sp. MD2005]